MICSACGAKCDDNAKFCVKCGTAFQTVSKSGSDNTIHEKVNVTESKDTIRKMSGTAQGNINKKNNINPKVVLSIVAILLLLIFIKKVIDGKTDFIFNTSKSLEAVLSYDRDEVYVYNSKGDVIAEIDTDGEPTIAYNMDSSIVAILTDEELYYVNAKGSKEIADGVETFYLSDNGKGIAYLTDVDGTIGTLYLYNASKDENKKIDGDVHSYYIALSPDGKSVAYSNMQDYDEFEAYISIKGNKPKSIGNDIAPIAIADGGKYIYYIAFDDDDSYLYVKKGKEANKLTLTDDYRNSSLAFNKNYSQVIYSTEEKTYISINGKDKQKISSSEFTHMLGPSDMARTFHNNQIRPYFVYGISNFKNKIIYTYEGYYYIKGNYETKPIISNAYTTYLSNDGNKLLYLDYSGDINYIKNLKDNLESEEITENMDITSFVASPDCSAMYFVTEEEDLYYQKGTKKPKKIADEVFKVCLNQKGNTAFFLTDYRKSSGTLYYSKNGGKKKAVESGDDVYSLGKLKYGVSYYEESGNGYDMYYNGSGVKFKSLVEDVSNY